jgi:hypothetical protein
MAGVDDVVLGLVSWDPEGDGAGPQRVVAMGYMRFAGDTDVDGIAYWDPSSNSGQGGWHALGSGFGLAGSMRAITTWDPDGSGPQPQHVVIGGSFTGPAEQPLNRIAHWDPSANGGAGDWLPFGQGLPGTVFAITKWDPDGDGPMRLQVVAGGQFTLSDGGGRGLARWDPDAAGGAGAWVGFGPESLIVTAATVWDPDADGAHGEQLIIGGRFALDGAKGWSNAARWDPNLNDSNGGWVAIGPPSTDYVRKLATWDPDGAGPAPARLAGASTRFRSDDGLQSAEHAYMEPVPGASWTLMPLGFSTFQRLIVYDEDGDGPDAARLIAPLSNLVYMDDTHSTVFEWDQFAQPVASWRPWLREFAEYVNDVISWDPDGSGPKLPRAVVGGNFSTIEGKLALRLATFDSDADMGVGAWRTLGDGPVWPFSEVTSWDRDGLGPADPQVVARAFTSGPDGDIWGAATLNAPAAQIDQGAWESLGDSPNHFFGFTELDVDSEGPEAPMLLAIGSVPGGAGEPGNTIVRWSDESQGGWLAIGPPPDPASWGDAITPWKPVAGGDQPTRLVFASSLYYGASQGFRGHVSLWQGDFDGSEGQWLPMGGEFSKQINVLLSWSGADGAPESVVAGGDFVSVAGVLTGGVAQWSQQIQAWEPMGSGLDGRVIALARFDPDEMGPEPTRPIAAGYLAPAGGARRHGVYQYLPAQSGSGGSWSALTPSLNGQISALAVLDFDNAGPGLPSVVVGGSFVMNDPIEIRGIARWEAVPGLLQPWRPLGSGLTFFSRIWGTDVYSMASFDPDGAGRKSPKVLVGGWFIRAGGTISPNFALFGRPDCLCPGDADGNLSINFADITNVLTNWGAEYLGSTGLGDTTGDGFVDFADIGEVLAHFNTSCE